jgi:hypothetical protein
MNYFRLLLVLGFFSSAAAAGGAERFIVRDGRPEAEIVIAERPQRTVRLAADELQTVVKQITGARLPIVTKPSAGAVKLFVGRSSYTDELKITADELKFGAYRLVSGDDWLVFLGDDTDFVPREPWARNNADIKSGKLQAAWDAITGALWGVPNTGLYKYRHRLPPQTGLPDGAVVDPKAPAFELWGLDERGSYNAVCGYLKGLGVRWFMPGPLGEIVPTLGSLPLPKIDETVKPDFEMRRFNVRMSTVPPDTARWALRLGMRDPADLQVAHGMATMTSRDEIFKAHPEWFALYGGVRRYQPGYTKNQLCYSNEELFQETLRYVRAQFDQYGYSGVSVMPPDGYTAICQCPLCAGKDEPQRGSRGLASNHVWEFTNRVAKEIAKTHPDKLIVNCAYGCYTDPPTNIEKLEPNVQVVIVGGRRPRSSRAEDQEETRRLRAAWKAKTDRPYMIFENYPITGRGWYLPAYVAQTIGRSINETKGESAGEDIWLSFGPTFEKEDLGFNHFQVYFTAAMYWGGKQQSVEPLLEEYCRLFYGPAAAEMRTFFDYCEAHWADMETDKALADEALRLFAAANAKADSGSVYAQRMALVDDFLHGLRKKSALLGQKRGPVPTLRMVGEAKDIKIDGRLDDAYWRNCPVAATARLRELQTGREAIYGTSVMSGCDANSVYFAIRCAEKPGEKLNITAVKKEDAAIWYGDLVELLIETDEHSYYQIALNPGGALVDYDRGADKSGWSGWESQAEYAVDVADDHWTVEIRIPYTSDQNDPLNQLVGNKPSQSLPWHINVCRQRIRDNGVEHSALSPTGVNGFHDRMKFANFYDGRSHQFEADDAIMDFIGASRAAAQLAAEQKLPEALAAYRALADGKTVKVTDLQKSVALKQAIAVAAKLKDFTQADELVALVPVEAERKNADMQNLLAQRKFADLLKRYGDEDLGRRPFTSAGEAYFARGRAYAATGDKAKAEADFRAALPLTADKRVRADLLKLLGEEEAK